MLLLTSSVLSYALHRLAFGVQGEIKLKDGHIRMPFSPTEIPLFKQHNKKMAYVYITDYLLSSGFMAAFVNRKLTVYVNNSLVSVVEATRFSMRLLLFLFCFYHCFLSNVHRLQLLVCRSSPPASRVSFIASRFMCIVHRLLLLV